MSRWFPPAGPTSEAPDALGELPAGSLPLGDGYPPTPIEVLATDGELKDPPVYVPAPTFVPPIAMNSDLPKTVQVLIPKPAAGVPGVVCDDDEGEDEDEEDFL